MSKARIPNPYGLCAREADINDARIAGKTVPIIATTIPPATKFRWRSEMRERFFILQNKK